MALQLVKNPLSWRTEKKLSNNRTARWLKSSYFDNVWIIADTAGLGKTRTIDFAVPMADGRLLTEHPSLLSTVKELLYWLRSGNYTRIDSASTHAGYALGLLQLAYGLTARGFTSFADLKQADIDAICEDGVYGVDGVTHSSHILRKAMDVYSDWSQVPVRFAWKKSFNLAAILDAYNLPPNWAQTEIKSELSVTSARLDGWLLASVADAKVGRMAVTTLLRLTVLFDALFALRTYIEAPTLFRHEKTRCNSARSCPFGQWEHARNGDLRAGWPLEMCTAYKMCSPESCIPEPDVHRSKRACPAATQ